MKPEISIIVPVYNVEKYLSKCIESILNQSLNSLELILIIDGSTDGSEEICSRYSRRDPRVIVIKKKNGGQASARNVGLNIAKGKYIGFVDSDDWIEEDMFETLYKIAEETSADISNISYNEYYENGIYKKHSKTNNKEIIIHDKYQAMKTILEGELYDDIIWSKLFRRELFNDIRFPELRRYEDTAIIYKIIDKCNKICYKDVAKYNYLRREDSTMGIAKQLVDIENLFIYEEMYEFISAKYKNLSELVIIRIANTSMLAMNRIIYNKRFKEEKQKFYEAARILNKYFKEIITIDYYPKNVRILFRLNKINPIFYLWIINLRRLLKKEEII